MLKIFYARESVNKSKFIFENIKAESLVLVPDQFTLEAEKDALRYMSADGIMDIEVMSMSRLGFRVLRELGGGRRTRIGRYGRHMLLTKLTAEAERAGELSMYGGMSSRPAFIDMLSNLISEVKQYGITPRQLADIADKEGGILGRKLADVGKIYEKYEMSIEGRFADAEDYMDLFLPKLSQSELIRDREVWVYGFDYFSPKNIELIRELAAATEVRIVLTCDYGCRDEDVFSATQRMISQLRSHVGCEVERIEGYERELPESISTIERKLFALPHARSAGGGDVTMVKAANYYAEAETAAAHILTLIRDKGLKLGEILVICNDTEKRGSIIKRVFSEYGLELFIDRKKSILGNPAAAYIAALLRAASGMETEDVMALLKTGLCKQVSADEAEKLENYAIKYKIRGKRWSEPFKYGVTEYGEEEFAELNDIRERTAALFGRFAEEFKRSRVTSDRLSALYFFLRDEACLPEMIERYAAEKEESGLFEAAQETAQLWNELIEIIEQLNELLGEETLSLELMSQLIESGLAAVEIGVIPPTADCLMLGTMQRTRAGRVRALVVMGANDGLLPSNAAQGSLLSEEERMRLAEDGSEISKLDALRAREETLAIYKNLSSAEESLFMSCSASDLDGKPERPAQIFNDLYSLFEDMELQRDIIERGTPMDLIQARGSALRHLMSAVKEADGRPEWRSAAAWYRRHEPEILRRAERGLFYKARKQRLDGELARKIFPRDMTVSGTRLERYGKCPFSHFAEYVLRPEERRVFELAGRESGEIYHTCLLELSQRLTAGEDGMDWQTVTSEGLSQLIGELIDEQRAAYREGLLGASRQEEYGTRRLKEVLKTSAEMLVEQARAGRIKKMFFEEPFGKRCRIPAIGISTQAGDVYIEGKIDRIDILEDDTVKIIDYKSGSESFDVREAAGGVRLQLMIYLKAALGIDGGNELKPAGIFYFHIKEPDLAADGKADKIAESLAAEFRKEFKMNGLIVNNRNAVENIAGDFARYSDIVAGLQRVADNESASGCGYSGSAFMEASDFDGFMDEFDKKLKGLVSALFEGEISAAPKKWSGKTSCEYCRYRGICGFDVTLPGCAYDRI